MDSESLVEIIDGNLLEATETYIVHQCNCTSTNAKTLAKDLFEAFPFANTYSKRIFNDKSTFSKPGSIDICKRKTSSKIIINMYSQYYPVSVSKGTFDNKDDRIGWFRDCLEIISEYFVEKNVPQKKRVIAMPFNIGCGAGGGNWDIYFEIIKSFALNHNIKIRLYKLKFG